MKELINQLQSDFPFDPSTDCIEKYTETIGKSKYPQRDGLPEAAHLCGGGRRPPP